MTRIKPRRVAAAYRRMMAQSDRPSDRHSEAAAELVGVWGMSMSQATSLGRHSKIIAARRGELIAPHGAPLPGVFYLSSGTVKLSLRGPDDEERVLRIVAAGDCFGEPTALIHKPCLYDAYALTDAKVVVMPTKAILSLLDHDRRFARAIVLAIAERSFGILAEFSAATTQRGAQRLAGYLESLERRNGSRGPIVQLPVSKTVVAALLGMKKETLSRLLRQFTSDGMIGMTRREIAILDPARLRTTAGESPVRQAA